MKPYLSIIIPAYQEEKNLPLLLKSIFSSSFQNFEVIIGDDASLTSLESLVGSSISIQDTRTNCPLSAFGPIFETQERPVIRRSMQ